jgi:AcrR family transcriptional regulator
MSNVATSAPRKSRADGQRNRAMILEAAKQILSEKGASASLEEIAQAAGVGNGTLYRHFPTRGSLVEAVCREDTRELVEAATSLSSTHKSAEALRAWMENFVDYIATKQNVAEVTSALVSPSSPNAHSSSADVRAALTMLYNRASDEAGIRTDFDPLDLMRAVGGLGSIGFQQNWEQSAKRLVGTLIAGLAR